VEELEALGTIVAHARQQRADRRDACARDRAVEQVGRRPRAFDRLAFHQADLGRLAGLDDDMALGIGGDVDRALRQWGAIARNLDRALDRRRGA
jgi:hypothetical protein